MSMYGVIHAARRIVANGPLVRPARLKWERQQFLSPKNHAALFGVYASFEQARQELPQENPGFHLETLSGQYVNIRIKRVFEYDYPVMRWLEKAFQLGATRVLDIGGSVGVHYFAYRRYLEMPAALTWEIVEVSEMVGIGRRLAQERDAASLKFTTDLNEAIDSARHDIWISAGAIQYFEDAHPADLLRRSESRPAHVLLNKLPLHDGEDFVTAQNLGQGAFSPFHVYNRARFIESIEALGYTLWDAWDVHELSLHIPGHPERSFGAYSGLYFVDTKQATPDRKARPVSRAGLL
ncbi:MAG: methyltransferase, TIGR04325 family [Proteobacteria bacterium]|nr:methyltransferase, TIGR04325 family [Pseudomonadota bacterium]